MSITLHMLPIWAGWIIAAVAFGAVLGFILRLVVDTIRIHGTHRLSAQPTFVPTTLENLPITFRPKLGDLIYRIQNLGFVVVANVTTREPSAPQQVTQCMLVHYAAGARAAIFCMIIRNKYRATIHFVNEYSDGTEIRTNNSGLISAVKPRAGHYQESMPRGTMLEELYARHEARVIEYAPVGATAILPTPGQELEFITQRHAESRAQSMPRNGLVLDSDSQQYRPTWKLSLIMAAERHRLLKPLMRWRNRHRFIRSPAPAPAPTDTSSPGAS